MNPTRAHRQGLSLVVLAAGQAKRYGGLKPLAPVGPAGEAVIDLLASDALAAGFARIVLVVGPSTGPAVRYHVERTWPRDVDVHFAVQESPRGTVDAVMSASIALGAGEPFGVANADDLYGVGGLRVLADALAVDTHEHTVVCYRLRDTLVGDGPVTRGICFVGGDGLLVRVDERRKVTPMTGGRIVAYDGHEPADLDPDAWVSVNLWGFRPSAIEFFSEAMAQAGDGEVLLPEVVADVLTGRRSSPPGAATFRVAYASGRCIGVTHPGDLPMVQAELAGQVGRGERPARRWSAVAVAGTTSAR